MKIKECKLTENGDFEITLVVYPEEMSKVGITPFLHLANITKLLNNKFSKFIETIN